MIILTFYYRRLIGNTFRLILKLFQPELMKKDCNSDHFMDTTFKTPLNY